MATQETGATTGGMTNPLCKHCSGCQMFSDYSDDGSGHFMCDNAIWYPDGTPPDAPCYVKPMEIVFLHGLSDGYIFFDKDRGHLIVRNPNGDQAEIMLSHDQLVQFGIDLAALGWRLVKGWVVR